MNIINPSELELNDETVVAINRVSKTISGGRRFRFNAIVVVGDGKGHLGIGFSKANEVISAINKAKESAKKHIFKINLINGVLPHEIVAKFRASQVLLKPATPGTGLIANATVRAILEQAGVKDVLTKVHRSTNPINVVKAVEKGLKLMRDPYTVSRQRGISLNELFN